MKSKLIAILTIIGLLFIGGVAADSTAPDTIPAKLHWECETNWVGAGGFTTLLFTYTSSGEDHVYSENGTISSNLVAEIVWKGATARLVIERQFIGMTNRSYTLKTSRVYDHTLEAVKTNAAAIIRTWNPGLDGCVNIPVPGVEYINFQTNTNL